MPNFKLNEKITSPVTGRTYVVVECKDAAGQSFISFCDGSDGKCYFLKKPMKAVVPDPKVVGEEAAEIHQKKWNDWYERKSLIYTFICRSVGEESPCVPILDFFRWGSEFVAVYQKIDASSLTIPDVNALPENEKLTLLRDIVCGCTPLYDQGVVHSDLKPDNILIQRSEGCGWKIRIIDIDDCYKSKHPYQEPGELIGTAEYWSPEMKAFNQDLLEYMDDEDYKQKIDEYSQKLTTKSDIFTIGILFCEYLTGMRPQTVDGLDVCKMEDDSELKLPEGIPSYIEPLIRKMLRYDYMSRPTMDQVRYELNQIINPAQPKESPLITVKGRDVTMALKPGSPIGAQIFYTTDGSDPTTSSIRYDGPFIVSESVTKVKAIAAIPDKPITHQIPIAWMPISPKMVKAPILHYRFGTVSIECEPGCKVYYTDDGSKPTNTSKLYTEPFDTPDTTKFHYRAICIDEEGRESPEGNQLKRP